MEKLYSSKTYLKIMSGGGMHPPLGLHKLVTILLTTMPGVPELGYMYPEMGSIGIHVSAIRIARYFCIDIGIALAIFESIAYRYRLTHILRIADINIADTALINSRRSIS